MNFFQVSHMFLALVTFGRSDEIVGKERVVCSRFDYMDKMLDKVIRLEVKCEQIFEEMKDTKKKELTKTKDIEQRMEEVETNIMNFQKDIREALKILEEDLVKRNTELDKVKERVLVPVVTFNVRLSSSVYVDANNVIVFDTVMMNEGECYDNSTGMFTAPRQGLYFFSAHVCNKGGSYVQYALVVDDVQLATSTQYDSVYSCSSVSTFARLKKEERVWLKSLISDSAIHTDNYRWNSFVGAFLSI